MMNYKVLNSYSMPFNRELPFDWEGYLVGNKYFENPYWIKKLSKYDLSEIGFIEVECNVYSFFEDCIYCYHSIDRKIKRLNVNTLEMIELRGHLFPVFNWETSSVFYNLYLKKYEVIDRNNLKIFEVAYQDFVAMKFIASGILLFQNDKKENNWMKCLDPANGQEKWVVEYPWQFADIEIYNNLIFIYYRAYENIRTDKGYEGEIHWMYPNPYTIALDGQTGEELWRYPAAFHSIDRKNGVVLTGINDIYYGKIKSLTAVELDAKTGKIITDVEVNPKAHGIRNSFVDSEGIYYRAYDGSFGKINRANGQILWEFELVDEKGEKRKLGDWFLLGNGKLVLQAEPNHPNGKLMCVFDPLENREWSMVKDGVRTERGKTG